MNSADGRLNNNFLSSLVHWGGAWEQRLENDW